MLATLNQRNSILRFTSVIVICFHSDRMYHVLCIRWLFSKLSLVLINFKFVYPNGVVCIIFIVNIITVIVSV